MDAKPDKSRQAFGALSASALSGMVLGFFRFSTWQTAVESAQVLAGSVSYPPENAFYVYHLKAWTLLHQLLALCLRAGLDERLLSLIVSALLGGLTFFGLSLIVYALCSRPLLAFLAPWAIFALYPGTDMNGVV